MPLDLRPGDLEIVRGILAAFVPSREVRAFGSRAAWTARSGSDLDLVVCGREPLPEAQLAALRDAFSSSNLPCKVDVVDAASVTPRFLRVILGSSEVVQSGLPTPAAEAGLEVRLADVCRLVSGVRYRIRPAALRQEVPPIISLPLVGLRELSALHGHVFPGAAQSRMASAELVAAGPAKARPVPPGTTVLAARGAALARNQRSLLTCDAVLGSGVIGVVPDPTRVDAHFLFYSLELVDLRPLARGISIPYVTPGDLEDIRLLLPPLSTQRDIGQALHVLDEMLALNQSLNATLEATVRAVLESRRPRRGSAATNLFALRPLIRRQRLGAAQGAALAALRAAVLPQLVSGSVILRGTTASDGASDDVLAGGARASSHDGYLRGGA